jgi:putative transposase
MRAAPSEAGLVLQALQMAIGQRRPGSVIHHSFQGCQYTSIAFGKRCEQLGVRPSMGSVGDAYDNAMAESFFATLECELLERTRFQTQAEARMAVFEWIEGWYNPQRRHSSIGYLSPNEFERPHAEREPGGLRPPHPPFTLDRSEDQEGLGLESGQPSTESR